MGSRKLFSLALLTLCTSLCLGQGQTRPRNAQPIKIPKVRNDEIAATDLPTSLIVLFGGATVGTGVTGAHASTVNVAQMGRTLQDVGMFGLPIDLFVSLGGLVSNGTNDAGRSMVERMSSWRSVFQESAVKAQFLTTFGCEGWGPDGKVDPAARLLWQDWTTKNGWSNASAQSKTMDYTARKNSELLIFLDTESGPDLNLPWLKEQLDKGTKDNQVRHIFVFGFRTLAAPGISPVPQRISDFSKQDNVAAARKLIATNPKVAGYFCGSPGMFDISVLEKGSSVNQVVIGNSGGPFEPLWKPVGGPQFGFGVIQALSNSTVTLITFNRLPPPEGQPFFEARPVAPTGAKFGKQVVLWSKKPTNS